MSGRQHWESHLAVWRARRMGAVGQGCEFEVAEQIGRIRLQQAQYLTRHLANLDFGVLTSPQLDEVTQGPGVGGHEDFRLRRVR